MKGSSSALGPLLAPLGLIALVPLAVQLVRDPVRRAVHAVAAVLAAALVAGLADAPLPLTSGVVGDLGVAGQRPVDGRRPGSRAHACATTRRC